MNNVNFIIQDSSNVYRGQYCGHTYPFAGWCPEEDGLWASRVVKNVFEPRYQSHD